MAHAPQYVEASTPVGVLLLAIGFSTWGAQYAHGIFTGWIFALLTGGLWVVFGALLLFRDVRLYQYERSPMEQLLLDESEESGRSASEQAG